MGVKRRSGEVEKRRRGEEERRRGGEEDLLTLIPKGSYEYSPVRSAGLG
jgi:hypothetical protein